MNIIHAIFSICCHQYADRSPHYADEIFPVCYRCAGLYFGIISSYLFLFVRNASYFSLDRKTALVLTSFTLPLCIDGLANLSGIWSTPGSLRAITGILCGTVLPLLLLLIRNSSIDPQQLHKINPLYLLVPLSISSCLVFLLSFPSSLFMFCTLALIAALGMVLFFLNMITALFYLKSPVFFS